MAFLGIFGRRDPFGGITIEEVRKNLRELELDEARLGRRAGVYRERKESIEDYIRREPYITDDEMVQFALDITELEHDIAAQNDQLSRVRDEKRAVKGILILKEREARLKRGGVWSVITKMGPEQLQESLIKLGDAGRERNPNRGGHKRHPRRAHHAERDAPADDCQRAQKTRRADSHEGRRRSPPIAPRRRRHSWRAHPD